MMNPVTICQNAILSPWLHVCHIVALVLLSSGAKGRLLPFIKGAHERTPVAKSDFP